MKQTSQGWAESGTKACASHRPGHRPRMSSGLEGAHRWSRGQQEGLVALSRSAGAPVDRVHEQSANEKAAWAHMCHRRPE